LLASALAHSTARAADRPSRPQAANVVIQAPVDLNAATAVQLESLPGIGPRTAQRIIEYREKNGGFKKIEELMNVRGVGEKSFLKIKDRITVAPPKAKDAPAAPKQ
jgi:competence protein ComEA